jgi:HAMP domain-containing protein
VTRVAREVGTEGKLGGQAVVTGVAGTWKDLTDSVNSMASNLTDQVRNIAEVTTAVANGDLSRKITVNAQGEMLGLKNTIGTVVDQLGSFASEVTRVAREVGTEGKLGGRAQVKGVAGVWKDLTDSVNSMAGNLTNQARNIADVTTRWPAAIFRRRLRWMRRARFWSSRTPSTPWWSSSARSLRKSHAWRARWARKANWAARPACRVGGTWKDLTDSVNSMAGNLTSQVRNIAAVTTAARRAYRSRPLRSGGEAGFLRPG